METNFLKNEFLKRQLICLDPKDIVFRVNFELWHGAKTIVRDNSLLVKCASMLNKEITRICLNKFIKLESKIDVINDHMIKQAYCNPPLDEDSFQKEFKKCAEENKISPHFKSICSQWQDVTECQSGYLNCGMKVDQEVTLKCSNTFMGPNVNLTEPFNCDEDREKDFRYDDLYFRNALTLNCMNKMGKSSIFKDCPQEIEEEGGEDGDETK